MTKNGELSNRDRQTILRAAQIVEEWVKAQYKQGNTMQNSFVVNSADNAAMGLRELLWQTR